MAESSVPGAVGETNDPDAIRALHRLFFILERLDVQAHNPGPRAMVEVTAVMWRDQISPDIRIVRATLSEEKA